MLEEMLEGFNGNFLSKMITFSIFPYFMKLVMLANQSKSQDHLIIIFE